MYLFLHLVDHVLNVNAETLKLSLLGVLFVDQAQSSVQREEIIHVVLQLVKDVKLKSAVIVGACLVQVEEEKQVGPLVMLCSYMFLESLYLKNKNLLTTSRISLVHVSIFFPKIISQSFVTCSL